jgi:hypothetical protein
VVSRWTNQKLEKEGSMLEEPRIEGRETSSLVCLANSR